MLENYVLELATEPLDEMCEKLVLHFKDKNLTKVMKYNIWPMPLDVVTEVYEQ